MVKVEIVLNGNQWELNILKREDATEEELKIAKAIEELHLKIWEKLIADHAPESTLTRIE